MFVCKSMCFFECIAYMKYNNALYPYTTINGNIAQNASMSKTIT